MVLFRRMTKETKMFPTIPANTREAKQKVNTMSPDVTMLCFKNGTKYVRKPVGITSSLVKIRKKCC